MSKLVETIVQALRESPLYKDNEFVQSEELASFVRLVVTQREDGMPDLVQSILNHYFELQREEKAAQLSQHAVDVPTGSPPTQTEPTVETKPPTFDELKQSYKERLVNCLADRYAKKMLLKEEQVAAGASQPPKPNDEGRNEMDGDSAVTKVAKTKTTSEIEKSLTEFRLQFHKMVDMDKEINAVFPFFTADDFIEILNELCARKEHFPTWLEDAYKLFDSLRKLSLIKMGEPSPTEARKRALIDGRLEKYIENRERFFNKNGEVAAEFYRKARACLRAASKNLLLPDDYFIRILDVIADNKGFRMVVHGQIGIVKSENMMGQQFENEVKVGGRAGGSEVTPASDKSALNAMATRALNVVLPEDIENKPKAIFKLIKAMGFDVTEGSVKLNIQRASIGVTDNRQTENEGMAAAGSLFQLGAVERVENHLSELLRVVGNRD